ncbi:MAG: outer membrane receptor protein involved in Fe transport [Candidatus Azotimanducaceae bacterium]|jgi:outer membrane receptor protein involved in Fe transport
MRFISQMLLLTTCLTPLLGFALNEIEEVKVVADFRGAEAASLATSLSVLDADKIAQSGARHFDELISALPNVNFSGGTSRARFFQIRGIGERSQFAEPLNPSVGYIVDNVDFSGVGSIGTLMDVSQVEVFRGPQGTRYGANALAGLIYIKTNDPVQEQSLNLSLSAGEYDHRTLGLVVNQPLSEGIAIRLAVEKHESNGFYENDFLDIDDNNARDELTARLKLAVDDLAGWQVIAGASHVDVNNGYDVFTLNNSRRTLSDQPGQDDQTSLSLFVEASRELANAELTLIGAHADSELEYSYDEDWTFTGFDPIGYTSFDQYLRDKSITSFEARLLSNPNSRIFGDSTDWLVGIYRLEQKEDLTRNYTFAAGPFDSRYDFDTSALFFQMDTQLSDRWELGWGARWERRNTDYDNSEGTDVSPGESLWGGRVALKYDLAPGTMTYLSVARGYKAGGFNTDGTLPSNLREFDSESLIEWELGIKSRLMNNRLTLTGAIFFDERKDQQVKSSFVESRPDGSTEFIDFLGNAAEGTNRGLEMSVVWLASDHFSVDASMALLDAKFDEFINEFGEDLSGRDQAQAPGNSYQVGLNWQMGTWRANLSLVGKDDFFFSDRHDLKSEEQNLVNANIAYQKARFSINLWGRNLGDRDYTVRGFGSFGNNPQNGYQTEPYVQFGEPRVIGITTEYRLGSAL